MEPKHQVDTEREMTKETVRMRESTMRERQGPNGDDPLQNIHI